MTATSVQAGPRFRNRVALFGWGLTTCFLAICAMFSYLLLRDGPGNIAINPPENMNTYPALVMLSINLVFWTAGIAAAAHFWRKPCVLVEVLPDRSVMVCYVYPLSRECRRIANEGLYPARVVETRDSEDDPYFECRLSGPGGFDAILAEGSSREICESACAEYNAALGRNSSP